LNPIAARHLEQFQPARLVVRRQRRKGAAHFLGIRPIALVEYAHQLVHRQRATGSEQRRFNHILTY